MTWDELWRLWNGAIRAGRNAAAQEHLKDARARITRNTAEVRAWLAGSLADPGRRWFVAAIFRRQPVPRRLLAAMIRAATDDADASDARWFVEPCVETFGRRAVAAELDRLANGGIATAADIAKARYWLGSGREFGRGIRPPCRND